MFISSFFKSLSNLSLKLNPQNFQGIPREIVYNQDAQGSYPLCQGIQTKCIYTIKKLRLVLYINI